METSKFIYLNTAKIFSDTKVYDFPRSKAHKHYTPFKKIPFKDFPGMMEYHSFASSFLTNLAFVDRSHTLTTPFNMVLDPQLEIPVYQEVSYSYEECVDQRAKELLALDTELTIMYGGGIDSITMLTALTRNATPEQRSNLVIATSEDAILTEHAYFKNYIANKFKIIPSIHFNHFLGSRTHTVVTAEGNDELFGTNYIKRLVIRYGSEVLDKEPTKDFILQLLDVEDQFNIKNTEQAEKHTEYLFRVATKSPVILRTVHQFFWWINFCLLWNTKQTRLYGFVEQGDGRISMRPEKNYFNFFSTKEFQLWSMNETGSWHTKQEAKKYIDIPELLTKGKINNLNTICYNKPTAFAIDANLRYFDVVSQLEPEQFLLQENSFL
jgi:hypothetical protein